MAGLLYGTGMRINELLRLQDVDYNQNRLIVRGGKGNKDRYVPFPLVGDYPGSPVRAGSPRPGKTRGRRAGRRR